jgi:hypothetical protein
MATRRDREANGGHAAERELRRLTGRAYHEAGHAVAALRLNHGIGPVTVRPDPRGGFLGRAWITFSDNRWGGDPAVFLAGHYAEKRRFRSVHWLGCSETDVGKATRVLDRLFGPADDGNRDARATLWLAWERGTREMVKDPEVWNAIEVLAAALLEKKTLSGLAARAIVEPILRPGGSR